MGEENKDQPVPDASWWKDEFGPACPICNGTGEDVKKKVCPNCHGTGTEF